MLGLLVNEHRVPLELANLPRDPLALRSGAAPLLAFGAVGCAAVGVVIVGLARSCLDHPATEQHEEGVSVVALAADPARRER
jgi:hypothetical protein